MISIIDYGIGNLGSIANMLDYIGVETEILSDPDKIYNAKKIIMPGVGSFDAAISKINNINGLREVLNYKALKVKIPFLGICLGMQLFVNSSEEGNLSGFGWIDGKVKKLLLSQSKPSLANFIASSISFLSLYFKGKKALHPR